MCNSAADEGPKERGNNSFLGTFVEPRIRYVSMRFMAFVVTYCVKHLLATVSVSLQNIERTYLQTRSDRICCVASSSLHLLHFVYVPLGATVLSGSAMIAWEYLVTLVEIGFLWMFFLEKTQGSRYALLSHSLAPACTLPVPKSQL